MKLKRYALMNDNTIITDIRQCNYDDKKYEYVQSRSKEGVVFMRELTVNQVKKTSDNILDLIEVKDLVEIEDGIMNVDGIYVNGISLCRDMIDKENVLAIYKRQLNGDYKRYEVLA